jgi:ubiquinone/menaquinone biosynthesis C-methylase UbiE
MTPQPVCPWWIRFVLFTNLRRSLDKPEQLLSEWVKPGMVVADIGCGTGYLTLPLARLVGEKGKVVAIDLQPRMLHTVHVAAEKEGLEKQIVFQLAQANSPGKLPSLDFAVSSWMLHEVHDPRPLLKEIRQALQPGGKYLFIEPILHVSTNAFKQSCALIESAGFKLEEHPAVALSHAALFQ